ncbi:MAG: KpsF/GutQ family sugar-phosphate isomerase [Nitrospirota bacterium]|nr:KpsF/GutQ family sugar-phosphate isomerase [Nitrospirota bacterium]
MFEIEAEAVSELGRRLGAEFERAIGLLLETRGKVVVTGMGKSGLIGQKIAATMASTGTPAFFLHPAEGLHGDLGIVGRDDLVVALSNSGETAELLSILPSLKRLGVAIIALTGKSASTLGRAASVVLDVGVAQEACPLNLAPTASTTAALAMGDALAVALLEAKGFSAEDFALSHPGGALGRRLLLRVRDGMHTGADIPRVTPDMPMREAVMEITKKRLGITTVVGPGGDLLGVLSDGDLRRQLEAGTAFLERTAGEVMTRGGRSIGPDQLAAEAVELMERHSVSALVVLEEGKLVGIVHLHDLLKLGLG